MYRDTMYLKKKNNNNNNNKVVAPVFKDVLLNRQHVGVGFYKALYVGKKEKNGRNNETYKYKYIYIYIYTCSHINTYIYICIYKLKTKDAITSTRKLNQ